MLDRIARVVRTETNIVRPDAPTLTVVDAHRLTPVWLVRRVARTWFTRDPGTPKFAGRRTTRGGRVEWHILWSRKTGTATTEGESTP